MKGIFVTGTGTGVGKTVATCAIANFLKQNNFNVGVMKPIATGGIRRTIDGRKRLASEDALLIKKAAQSHDGLKLINPVCLKNPLAPYTASLIEKRKISLNTVLRSFKKLALLHPFMLVEGAGGVRVPVSKKTETADLILKMKLPALVVASAKLGTINHTLLTLDYLKRKRIPVLGIVLNFFNKKDVVDRTNLDFFKKSRVPVLAVFPVQNRPTKHSQALFTIVKKSPLGNLLLRMKKR